MTNEIIVDAGINETRVALLEDKDLVELYIERSDSCALVGNIYRGKVCSVLPGMQAAFIDIGYEKNAFLYVGDAVTHKDYFEEDEDVYNGFNGYKGYNIEDILTPGQEITVQVIKEPIGTKGPRVTTHITLPGRLLVLLPNADYIGISRRIENEEERERLKSIAERTKKDGVGVIMRTASEGKDEEDFKEDIDFLEKLWDKIKQKEQHGTVPRCLHKDLNLVYRTVRDLFSKDIDKFIINDRQTYLKVIELIEMISPSLKMKVEYFSKNYDLFEYFQISSMINGALSKKVWLKSGGYIIVEQTEALTVIDVNTGKYVGKHNLEETVLNINIEATKEIAKQLRLRDLGGIIIIDFIDMYTYEHQKMVIDALKLALKKDHTKTTVVGITGLGLIEMTRKKVRQTLSSVMQINCAQCDGTGKILSPESVARNVEKRISEYFAETIATAIKVELHPTVASILIGKDGDNITKIENSYSKKIIIVPSDDVKHEEIKIREMDIGSNIC